MIHVIASIEVKPGKREAFLAEFRQNERPILIPEVGGAADGSSP